MIEGYQILLFPPESLEDIQKVDTDIKNLIVAIGIRFRLNQKEYSSANLTCWEDVKNVIEQLEEDKNILSELSKHEVFGFILGMLVGDVSNSQPNKDLTALTLSKKYETNKRILNENNFLVTYSALRSFKNLKGE